MDIEAICQDITNEITEKITSGAYQWDSICAARKLWEQGSEKFGLIIWCNDTFGVNKCFSVSIRKGFILEHWYEAEIIFSDVTDTDNFEELKAIIFHLLLRFVHHPGVYPPDPPRERNTETGHPC